MKGEERLELDVGTALALRATTELWQERVSLKVFYDGVTCGGVAEAEALAEDFHREPWDATPIEPRMNVVSLSALLDKTVNERADVCGVITQLEARHTAQKTHHPAPPPLYAGCTAAGQATSDFIRQSDGAAGRRQVFELSDASQRGIRVTVFMESDETPELECGVVVVVRGVVEIRQQQIALRALRDGVTRAESSEDTRRLEHQWRRGCWAPTPLVPRWKFISFDALDDLTAGAIVDVIGVLYGLDPPMKYTRSRDGTTGWLQKIELCDESCERCLRVTVFLDGEVSLNLKQGMVVALRAARVNAWQDAISLSVSESAVALDVNAVTVGMDVARASALRATAAKVAEEYAPTGDAAPLEVVDEEPSLQACRGGGFNCLDQYESVGDAPSTVVDADVGMRDGHDSNHGTEDNQDGTGSDGALEGEGAAAMATPCSSAMVSDLRASAHTFIPGAAAHAVRCTTQQHYHAFEESRASKRAIACTEETDGKRRKRVAVLQACRGGGCMALDAETTPELALDAASAPVLGFQNQQLSVYEVARLANIARNEATLRQLGLLDSRLITLPVTFEARRTAQPRPEAASRRSPRLPSQPTPCYVYTRPYTKRKARLLHMRGGGCNSLDSDTPDAADERPLRLVYIPVLMYLPVLVPTAPANEHTAQPPSAGNGTAMVCPSYLASNAPVQSCVPFIDGVASYMMKACVWHRARRIRLRKIWFCCFLRNLLQRVQAKRASAAALMTVQRTVEELSDASTEARDVDTTATLILPSAMSYRQLLAKTELKPTDVLLIEWSAKGNGEDGGKRDGESGTFVELAAVCSWADVKRGWLDADGQCLDRQWWDAPVVRCAVDGTTTILSNPRIVSYSVVRRSDATEAVLRVRNQQNALQLMALCGWPGGDMTTFVQEMDRRHRPLLATMHGAAVEADLPVGDARAPAKRSRATSSARESGDDSADSDSGDSWSSSGHTSESEVPSEAMDEEVVVASLAQPAATGPPQCEPVGCPSAQLKRMKPAKPCPPKKVSATGTTISLRLRVSSTPRVEHVELEYTRVNPRGKPRRIQVAVQSGQPAGSAVNVLLVDLVPRKRYAVRGRTGNSNGWSAFSNVMRCDTRSLYAAGLPPYDRCPDARGALRPATLTPLRGGGEGLDSLESEVVHVAVEGSIVASAAARTVGLGCCAQCSLGCSQGVGKSTVLATLAERFGRDARVVLLPEAVEAWRGAGLLDALYEGTMSSLEFQMVALVSGTAPLLEALRRPGVRVVVTEGSPASNRHVYAVVNLDDRQAAAYHVGHDALGRAMPARREVTILLDADVDTALRRIVTRGRDEERGISRDYLAALNAARESFFASVPHDKHRLDASRAPHEVAAAVSAIVASLVDGGWPSPLRIVGVPRGVVTYASCMARRSRPLAHAVTKPPARLQEHLAATRISACWRGFDDRQWGDILSLSRCLKHYQMELPVEPSVTVSVSTLRCPWSLMSYHASLSHLYRVFSCRAGTRRLHPPLERPERGPASGG